MARMVSQKLPPFRSRFAELAGLIGNPNKDRRAQVIGELSISRWREVLCGCGRGRGWCALCRCETGSRRSKWSGFAASPSSTPIVEMAGFANRRYRLTVSRLIPSSLAIRRCDHPESARL
jgi:hypothetical protein